MFVVACLLAVLNLIYGLALQLAFKVALSAVHPFWITLRFLSLCFNSRDTPAHVGGLKNDPLHGFSLCFAILLFAWTFDLLTSTFIGSCPSVELLIFILIVLTLSLNDGTSCWLDFDLRPLDPLFTWASRNLKACALEYLLSGETDCKLLTRLMTCDKWVKARQLWSVGLMLNGDAIDTRATLVWAL